LSDFLGLHQRAATPLAAVSWAPQLTLLDLAARLRIIAVHSGERITDVLARAIEPKLSKMESEAISRYRQLDPTRTDSPG
jgi:hypothetical protein